MSAIVYPECPSPKTKEDYEALVQSMLEAVIAEDKNQDWKSYSYKDDGESGFNDIKIFDKSMPGSELDAMKVTGTVPGVVQTLVEYMWDLDKRKKIEKDLVEVQLIERITPDIEVIKTRYSAPVLVTNRQFVLVRARIVKDGVSYVVACSINHPCAVEQKDYVLAVSKFNATIVRPADKPQHSVVTRYSQIDPKGSVPKFAANLSKSKLGDFMVCLRKLAIKA